MKSKMIIWHFDIITAVFTDKIHQYVLCKFYIYLYIYLYSCIPLDNIHVRKITFTNKYGERERDRQTDRDREVVS